MKKYLLTLLILLLALFIYTQSLPSIIDVKIGANNYSLKENNKLEIFTKEELMPLLNIKNEIFINYLIETERFKDNVNYTITLINYFGQEKKFYLAQNREHNKALVVINMQNSYRTMKNSYEVAKNIDAVAKLARENDIPVIFVQSEVNMAKGVFYGYKINSNIFVDHTDYIIENSDLSILSNKKFKELKAELDIEEVYICGTESELLIKDFIEKSSENDMEVILISDSHTTSNKDWKSTIDLINSLAIDLTFKTINSDDIIFKNE
jgi:nicotinamidase-related amidase